MKNTTNLGRNGERGAALVMLLLVSLLLLTAGGALIATTALSVGTAYDSTAEYQAYYAAEAGLESALNALRGHAQPSPLPVAIPAGGAIPDADKINFRKAITLADSNHADDDGTDARLSRWLRYNSPAAAGEFPDRVVLEPANPADYTPRGGLAYSVTISDPDDTDRVAFSTEARWGIAASVTLPPGVSVITNNTSASSSIRIDDGGNVADILFTPASPIPSSSPINTYPQATTPLGTFQISVPVGSAGLTIPPGVELQLLVKQTYPQVKTLVFTATLEVVVSILPPSTTVRLNFSLPTRQTTTTTYSLPSAFDLIHTGGGSSTATLQATLKAREPNRLLIRSTGYGPQGAVKRMEMLVTKFTFGLNPPAPIVIRGADTSTSLASITIGSSAAKKYSGADNAGKEEKRPAVAISLQDWQKAYKAITKPGTVIDPEVSILDLDEIPSAANWPTGNKPVPGTEYEGRIVGPPNSAVTPDFLVTADAAREFLDDLEAVARTEGRRFTSCSGVNTGSAGNPQFTFIEGNCSLNGGQGLLVVTGKLTFNGNDDFQGTILALGAGDVERDGGGNGKILGAWIIASFARTGTGGFLTPSFNTDGGGNGDFLFDSHYVDEANELLSHRVAGVAER